MTKRTHQNHRKNWTRLLSGLFVGGVLLFQGTGYITSAAFGADNQNVDVTNGGEITAPGTHFGLTGPESAATVTSGGNIAISGGTAIDSRPTAVVGVLDTDTDDLKVDSAVALTMGTYEENGETKYYDIILGDTSDAANPKFGLLYIAGTGPTAAAMSTVVTGGNVTIAEGSLLRIGATSDFTATTGAGSLQIYNGGSLSGDLSASALKTGLEIGSGSSLILGTAAENLTSAMDLGTMKVSNVGTITVYNADNADETSNLVTIRNYSDYSDTLTGKLTATGDLEIIPAPSIKGTVQGDDLALGINYSASGFTNSGTITSAGDTTLRGFYDNDTPTTEKVSVTNSGTMTVGGELWLTYHDNVGGLSFTNSAEKTVDVQSLNLTDSNVRLNNAGTFNFNQLTLTNGSLQGTYTGKKSQDTVPTVTLGVIGAETPTNVALTGDTAITAAAGASNVTFHVVGQSAMQGAFDLTFSGTDVFNDTALETSAFNVNTLIFGTDASYMGGKQIQADMTFNSGSELDLSDGETLTLFEGKDLRVTSGGMIAVDFGSAPVGDALITLSGDGTVDLATESVIDPGDLTKIDTGEYTLTLVKTQTTGNTYDSTLPTYDSVFIDSFEGNVVTLPEAGGEEFQLTLKVNDFESFGETPNEIAFGSYVDGFRTGDNYSDELNDMLGEIMTLDDADTVRSVYNALSAVNKANSLMLAMSDPWMNVFDQMNWGTHRGYTKKGANPYGNYGRIYRGQDYDGQVVYEEGGQYVEADGGYYDGYYDGYYAPGVFGSVLSSVFCPYDDLEPNSAWASFRHTSFNAKTDGNSVAYGISRTGVTVGYDLISANNVIAGIAFDYSQPFLYADGDRVNMGDFKLGFYGKREFYNQMELSVYFGGGFQDYTYKRDVNAPAIGQNARLRSTFSGGSVAAAVQLAKNFDLNYWSVIRPFVQFDTQQVWQESVEEDQTLSAAALRYNKADWNRSFIRAGFETEANNQFMRLTSRCFYAGQLGSDSAPEMAAGFAGDYSGNIMTVQGVDLGSSFFDVGVGALGYLDCDYRWAISGNYDYAVSDKSDAHTGVVSLSYTF